MHNIALLGPESTFSLLASILPAGVRRDGQFAGASAVLLDARAPLVETQIKDLTAYVRGGGGLVIVSLSPASAALFPLAGTVNEDSLLMDFAVSAKPGEHPIVHRIQDFRVNDRLYPLTAADGAHTLLGAWWAGKPQPLAIARAEGKGRVVAFTLGSDAALSHPVMRQLLARALRWAGGEDWSAKTVKVAAIGYGGAFNMGKLHLESCQRARLTPVAVCDMDPRRTATAKQELGEHMQTYARVEDLLDKSDAEMCIIITPHNTHAPLSIQCLKAGRHVVTEKPYTITVNEATDVIETARRVGKMATVFHNRRWDGDFTAIRELVQSGVIGDVFHIECAFGNYGEPKLDWWRAYKEASGGAFYDWGAHFVDWTLNLMPHRIESVAGDFKKLLWHQSDNEDYTSAYVRFAGGRSAFLESGSVNAIEKSRWRILGTKGGIEKKGWDWDGKEGLKLVTFQNGRRIESNVPYPKNDWDGFYRNVADHLLLGEPLAVTPESARKVIAVLSLAEESSKQGGRPLPLPFEQE